MVNRTITSLTKLCMAAALVGLGTTALLQVTGAAPAPVAGHSVRLFAWGENDSGQLGNGTSGGISTTPVVVALPSGVTPKAIAGSFDVAFAIGSDENLYAWGSGTSGELGNGTSGAFNSTTPVVVSLPSGVSPTAIAGSGHTGYAIGSDGHLYAWGADFDGDLGNGTVGELSNTPVQVSLPSGVTPKAIAAGGGTAYAIGSDKHLYAWGRNDVGELGNGSDTGPEICLAMTPCSTTPVPVSLPSGVTPEVIAGGSGDGYTIGSDGHLYAWGFNGEGELGNGTSGGISTTPVVVSLPSGVTPTAIAGGLSRAYAKGSNGHLYAWGDNGFGGLGTGTSGGTSGTPVQVSLPSGVTPEVIAGGSGDGYTIGSDGHLYAWGRNEFGELGNGNNTGPETCPFSIPCSSTPVTVSLPSGSIPDSLGPEPTSESGYAIVNAPTASLTITTTSLPPGTVGLPYSVQLESVGGTPPYTWNKYPPKAMGTLPLGVTLSKSGLISGTPKRAGTFTITVKCLDSSHSHKTQAIQSLTLTINP